MATSKPTKKQKEELVQTLKFTPRTYTISVGGYGGETYCGIVDRKIYDYFKAKKIDMEQYAWTWDDDMWKDIPEEMRPFEPGSPYDCDNFFHASGATFDDSNEIYVYDENNNVHWQKSLGYSLEDEGVVVECSGSNEIADLDEGTVVIWSAQGEKGGFFEGEIYLTAPFDPAKLKLYYEDCDGWAILTYIEYDGEEIDGSNGYSTTGKWNESKWIIVGDEEVYAGEEREEGEEYGQDHFDPAAELDKIVQEHNISAFQELANTLAERWNDASEKPETKGTYEVKFAQGVWPLGDVRNAQWTGRSWKENGKKAPEIIGWRERPWYPADDHPEQATVYEVRENGDWPFPAYAKWDGEVWFEQKNDAESAGRSRKKTHHMHEWREVDQ